MYYIKTVMSLALEKFVPVAVGDPRTLHYPRVYPVLKGAQEVLYKQYKTSNISASNVSFTCPPPGQNLLVDRSVYLRLPVQCSFAITGAVEAAVVLTPNNWCIRSFPLQKAMLSMQMTINSQAFSINIGDIMSCLEMFNMGERLKDNDYTKCATYPCGMSQRFNDLARAGAGSNRNPLNEWEKAEYDNIPFKNEFTITANSAVSAEGTATATVCFVSIEPLFLSPLFTGKYELNASGFYGVHTLDFSFNFISQASNRMIAINPLGKPAEGASGTALYSTDAAARAISINSTVSFTSGTYAASHPPALLFQYLTPQLVDRGASLEKIYNYPYQNIERFLQTQSGTWTAGSQNAVLSNNVQFSSIPSRIYAYVRASNSQMEANPFSPDAFMRLVENTLNIQWGGRSGLFASAANAQLHEISVRAGLRLPYADWNGAKLSLPSASASDYGTDSGRYYGCGTLLGIDPVDFGLDSLSAPGKLEQITFQLQATFENITGIDQVNPTLVIVAVVQGIVTLFHSQASAITGILTAEDILNAKGSNDVHEMKSYYKVRNIYGGNFLSDIKHDLRKLAKNKKGMEGGNAVAAAGVGGARVARQTLSQRLM